MKNLELPPFDVKSEEGQQIVDMCFAVLQDLFEPDSLCGRALLDFLSLPDDLVEQAISQEIVFLEEQERDETHLTPIQWMDSVLGAGRLLGGFENNHKGVAAKMQLRIYFAGFTVAAIVHMIRMLMYSSTRAGLTPQEALSAVWVNTDWSRFFQEAPPPGDNPFNEREIDVHND